MAVRPLRWPVHIPARPAAGAGPARAAACVYDKNLPKIVEDSA